jgi:outer membrane lipoprotein-sorting protein
MRTFLSVSGLLLSLVLPAAAQSAWTLEQLLSGLAARPSSEKRFTEQKTLNVLSEPLLLSGTLSYTAPNRLEKHVLTPNEEHYLVDGDSLLLENKSANLHRSFSLRNYPALWAFVESLRATLAGDAATLRRFYALQLTGGRQQWQLTLTPQQPGMAQVVSSIRIGGRADQVTRIEILENNGDRSLMMLEDR